MTDADALALARLAVAARTDGYPEEALETLAAHVRAVLVEDRAVNLTGAKSFERALDVLALDALPVARAWDASRGPPGTALDLGSGNGLPGLAVAVRWPSCRVVLVERRSKKARAVERCLASARVGNAVVLACDGREVLTRRPDLARAVDLVTVRAVGDLAPTTREAAPWLAPGGRVVHWKPGGLSDAERTAGLLAARAEGLRALADVEFSAGPDEPVRRLVVYERPGPDAAPARGARG